ncbi:lysozyme inhibitor LprI family protein, partial [Rhizobiaceae sp. 2RAB30]
MRLYLVPMLLVSPLLTGTALAQECNDSSNQIELNQCAARAFEAADRELNADFRDVQRRLGKDADTKRLLVDAQRAWILFRDAECTFQTSAAAQGTIFPLVYANCKAD